MTTKTRRGKYPWADWTDGTVWEVWQGEGFNLSLMNYQISLHGRARSHGLRVWSKSIKRVTGLGEIQEGMRFQFSEDNRGS